LFLITQRVCYSLAIPFDVVESLRSATKVVSSHDDLQKNGENLLAAIESHVGGVTHVKLASFRLERVSCTVGALGCDGRVKVQSGYVDRALRSLSQYTMHATLQQSDQINDNSKSSGGAGKRRRVRDENDNETTTNTMRRHDDVDDGEEEEEEDEEDQEEEQVDDDNANH
jgi:hypothetical protein